MCFVLTFFTLQSPPRWSMTPPTVNAYYSATFNKIGKSLTTTEGGAVGDEIHL